jgi:hypothetical protein
MKKSILFMTGVALSAGMTFLGYGEAAQIEKPKIGPVCKQCHAPDEKVLRGTLGGVSGKAGTIQIQVGSAAWLVKFDDDTKLIGTEKFSKIPKEKEIAVSYVEKDGGPYAASVSVKPPAKLPEEKLIKVDELAELVEVGPEKGNFLLVDSRPAPRYHEGHLPGAISIYDAEFDKMTDKLPKEKDALVVFYCAGVT